MIVTWIRDDDSTVDFEVSSVADVEAKAKELGFIPTSNWGYDDEAYTLFGEDGFIMINAHLIRGSINPRFRAKWYSLGTEAWTTAVKTEMSLSIPLLLKGSEIMKMTVNKKIALLLIKAQAASMAGKCQLWKASFCLDRMVRYERKTGYRYKEKNILDALYLITHSKNIFKFSVIQTEDQNGYWSVLIYIFFSIEGKHFQMSFHTPYGKASNELISYSSKGCKTHWDKKSSLITAEKLYEMIESGYFD